MYCIVIHKRINQKWFLPFRTWTLRNGTRFSLFAWTLYNHSIILNVKKSCLNAIICLMRCVFMKYGRFECCVVLFAHTLLAHLKYVYGKHYSRQWMIIGKIFYAFVCNIHCFYFFCPFWTSSRFPRIFAPITIYLWFALLIYESIETCLFASEHRPGKMKERQKLSSNTYLVGRKIGIVDNQLPNREKKAAKNVRNHLENKCDNNFEKFERLHILCWLYDRPFEMKCKCTNILMPTNLRGKICRLIGLFRSRSCIVTLIQCKLPHRYR